MNLRNTVLILLACLVLGGCNSPWQEHFTPARRLGGVTLPERESARVIEVEWERLGAYEVEARERAIERDVRPEQMSRADAEREVRALLDAVRVDVAPSGVLVVGSSRFISTDLLDPYEPAVRTFAASRGGDIAVVSVEPLGLRDTVEYATRTEWYERDIYDRTGRRRGTRVERRLDETVPVVVPRETWGYTLIVLRTDLPEQIEAFTGGRLWLP